MEMEDEYWEEGTPEEPSPAPAGEPLPGRPLWEETLREHWFKVLVGLAVLLFGGLLLWLRAARELGREGPPPVAAASEHIEQAIPEAATDRIESKSPSRVLEEQRQAELGPRAAPPTGEKVASAFVIDSAGRPPLRETTARADRIPGEPAPAAVPPGRRESAAAPASFRREPRVSPRERSPAGRAGSRAPSLDRDGTPFETNPEILRMLAASPPQTRQVYEQTTGRRYRDPAAAALPPSGPRTAPPAPGADGFHTFRAPAPEGSLPAEVFFRCVVSGEQKVRSGSVVTLRLLEEAVVGGVRFPRNLVFAAVARVGSNRVTLEVDRLGPSRVQATLYDEHYMPGVMIDPEKRLAREVDRELADLQRVTGQEISTAIDRSVTSANSVVGVAGRVAASLVGRPRTRQRLREVVLPDGYPLLITGAGPSPADRTP